MRQQTYEKLPSSQVAEPRVPVHDVAPSAPPAEASSTSAALLDKQVSVTARGLNSECAVCLDKEVRMLSALPGKIIFEYASLAFASAKSLKSSYLKA